VTPKIILQTRQNIVERGNRHDTHVLFVLLSIIVIMNKKQLMYYRVLYRLSNVFLKIRTSWLTVTYMMLYTSRDCVHLVVSKISN